MLVYRERVQSSECYSSLFSLVYSVGYGHNSNFLQYFNKVSEQLRTPGFISSETLQLVSEVTNLTLDLSIHSPDGLQDAGECETRGARGDCKRKRQVSLDTRARGRSTLGSEKINIMVPTGPQRFHQRL